MRVAEIDADRRAPPSRLRIERRLQLARAPCARAASRTSDVFRPDEIARSGDAERGARDEPLEVVHGLQRVAELAALGRAEGELLDRVEPIANRLDARRAAAAATTAAAGRPSASPSDRARRAATRRASRRSIPRPRGARASPDRSSRASEPACRRSRARARGRPSACRAGSARARRRRRRRRRACRGRSPRVRACAADRPACAARLSSSKCHGSIARDRQPRARDGGEVLGQRRIRRARRSPAAAAPRARRSAPATDPRPRTRAAVNSPVDRSSSATPMRSRAGRDRQQERRLARVEIARIEQRAGREHAHDLALDDALRLARVLHLLADRDAVALAHEAGQVRRRARDRGCRTSGWRRRPRPSIVTSASARAHATRPARPRRTSRRSRPSGRTRWRRDTGASRPGTGASRASATTSRARRGSTGLGGTAIECSSVRAGPGPRRCRRAQQGSVGAV